MDMRKEQRTSLRGLVPKQSSAFLLVCFAALAMTLLGGCAQDDADEPAADTDAVSFTATAGDVATRTATATDGTTSWLADEDEIGIFMLNSGGLPGIELPGDIARGADNRKYRPAADGATADLVPAVGTDPIYWPRTGGTFDFIAYYPWRAVGEGGLDPTDYTYPVDVSDQGADGLDVLHAISQNIAAGNNAIFRFVHAMTKVRINLVKGDDITDDEFAGITASLGGMPTTARLALTNFSKPFDAGNPAPIDMRAVTPGEGYAAAFEAIVIPQDANSTTGRYLRFGFTGNVPHYWSIPDADGLPQGKVTTYNLRMGALGVTLTGCTITPWDETDPATTDAADRVAIQPEANSYMVAPGGAAILIPISQANRVLDPEVNLGAVTTGLGGVQAGNFDVELVWGDTPVGADGVIREMKPFGKEHILVKPGDIPGNAVVAIRDKESGKIKWSWHIWVTPEVGSATDNETGLTWMDRNLGAKSNTPLANGVFDAAQWINAIGLYYQWGRKDPFPGMSSNTLPDNPDRYINQTYYIGNSTTGTTSNPSTAEYTDLPGMVQNPRYFASNNDTYYGSLNVARATNDSWGGVSGTKTLYDPCPPGWKVPPIQVGGKNIWGSEASADNSEWTYQTYITEYKGAIFNGVNGTSALGLYFPVSNYRYSGNAYHNGFTANNAGNVWTATPHDSQYTISSYFVVFNSLTTFPEASGERGVGRAVRCVKE